MILKKEYLQEIERQWKASVRKINTKELKEIFPEYINIVPTLIARYEEEKEKIEEQLVRLINDESIEVLEGAIRIIIIPRLYEIKKHLHRLRGYLDDQIQTHSLYSDEAIQKAKDVSIQSVISDNIRLRKVGDKLNGKCPFHEDRLPSLYVYPKTNSYYCFGCNEGGDVINFVKSLYSYTFPEAVKFLIGQ